MQSFEIRSLSGLAFLYASRMLGLFMVLPVLALYATDYSGSNTLLIGLALGVYGITQGLLQIPFGLVSDRIGRKPVILVGMLLFLLGSLIAATADSISGIILGRALQGAGAVASAIMALLTDLTREEYRVRAMAAVGGSIGVSFAVAMVSGPWVAAHWGLSGVFWITAGLSLCGILVVLFVVPSPASPKAHAAREVLPIPGLLKATLCDRELLRLDFGIFTMHMVQMACWVSVPVILETLFQFDRQQHWWLYLTTMGLGFISIVPLVILAEKRRKMKSVFVFGVAILAMAEYTLAMTQTHFIVFAFGLLLFFMAFNLLEACLPSLVSKAAAGGSKGTAMGIYSSSQFLGAFVGGAGGGWLVHNYGLQSVFWFSLVMALVWLVVAATMASPRHWSSLVVDLLDGERLDSKVYLAIPGVEDLVLIPEKRLAYVKVDKALFDRRDFEKVLGRPIGQ